MCEIWRRHTLFSYFCYRQLEIRKINANSLEQNASILSLTHQIYSVKDTLSTDKKENGKFKIYGYLPLLSFQFVRINARAKNHLALSIVWMNKKKQSHCVINEYLIQRSFVPLCKS